jgi:hypothetical protein
VPDFGAPLSQWTIDESFDTAIQCRAERVRRVNQILDAEKKEKDPEQRMREIAWSTAKECISTDDPHLKSN